MSKELEALERIVKQANERKLSNQVVVSRWDYELLRKALTPPTAEEVCKALGDYFDFDFFDTKCVFKDNGFHEECGGELIEVLIYYIAYQNVIYFYVDLPPHIVEMVARFYKGVVKHNE